MPGMHRHRLKGKVRPSFQRVMQLCACALFNGYALGFQKGKIFKGPTKAACVPVLNCYSCPGALGACPIGSLQGALGGRKHGFPFYVLGTLALFGVLLGRAVCGLLCPFGLVQDLLYKIPVPKIKVPGKIDRPARYIKYGVLLVLVVLLPAFALTEAGASQPWFCKYLCPAGTLGGGIPLLLSNPSLRQAAGALFHWKLLVLLLILAASSAIQRPFCKYLCPLGAFYALFNRFSFYQLQVDLSKCTGCGQCGRACPMGVEITREIQSAQLKNGIFQLTGLQRARKPAVCFPKENTTTRLSTTLENMCSFSSVVTINGPECIRCGRCKAACPAKAISPAGPAPRKKG